MSGNDLPTGVGITAIDDAEPSMLLMDEPVHRRLSYPVLAHGGRGHRYADVPSFRGLSEFWVRGEKRI
jgi:hypothetical protein